MRTEASGRWKKVARAEDSREGKCMPFHDTKLIGPAQMQTRETPNGRSLRVARAQG